MDSEILQIKNRRGKNDDYEYLVVYKDQPEEKWIHEEMVVNHDLVHQFNISYNEELKAVNVVEKIILENDFLYTVLFLSGRQQRILKSDICSIHLLDLIKDFDKIKYNI